MEYGMEFPDVVAHLQKMQAYSNWKSAHPACFLAHIFVHVKKDSAEGYQAGYYDPKEGKITSFYVKEKEPVKMLPPAEVLRDPEHNILELHLSGISLSTDDVLAKAHEVREEEYNNVGVIQTFFILQQFKEYGSVFNVTMVTTDFRVLNVKLSASTGEVLSHFIDHLIHREGGEKVRNT